MKKQTDDEILAAALLCPESEKVPLGVGDRVIALEEYHFWRHRFVAKGTRGKVLGIDMREKTLPLYIEWDYDPGYVWWCQLGPIGKLTPRRVKA